MAPKRACWQHAPAMWPVSPAQPRSRPRRNSAFRFSAPWRTRLSWRTKTRADPSKISLVRAGAPIDGFGVGTSLATSSDVPALDCAYKLQEYDGVARRKRSAGKATWPGRKQVWRQLDASGRMAADIVSLEDAAPAGTSLLQKVMTGGRRTAPPESLDRIRRRAALNLASLPDALRELEPASPAAYPVWIADDILRLAEQVDRRLAARGEP